MNVIFGFPKLFSIVALLCDSTVPRGFPGTLDDKLQEHCQLALVHEVLFISQRTF